MKKLILDIKTAIANFGAKNINASHFVHLYREVYTKSDIDVQIEVGPWRANPVKCIEVEMLLTQTELGPVFDEDAAREWVESLNLTFPPDDEALHRAAEKARYILDCESKKQERRVTQVTGIASYEQIGESLRRGNTYKRTDEEKKSYIALNAEADKVREIINGVKNGPNLCARRQDALHAAGYKLSHTVFINIGKSGHVKIENDSDILAQLASEKYRVYFIKKQL